MGTRREALHRVPVTAPAGEAEVEALVARCHARCPEERVVALGPSRFEVREEPPWYLVIVFGSTLGLGILGHVSSLLSPRMTLVGAVMGVLMDLLAALAALRLGWSLLSRFELDATGEHLELRERLGPWVLRRRALEPTEVLAALVLEGRFGRQVVLAGARNEPLARCWKEGWMDPPALAPALAGLGAALLARAWQNSRAQPRNARSP